MTGTGGASVREWRSDDARLCCGRGRESGEGLGGLEVDAFREGLATNGSANKTPEILARLPELGGDKSGDESGDRGLSPTGSIAFSCSTGGGEVFLTEEPFNSADRP